MTQARKDYPALQVFKHDVAGMGYSMTVTEFYAVALAIDDVLCDNTRLKAVNAELVEALNGCNAALREIRKEYRYIHDCDESLAADRVLEKVGTV